MKVLKFYADWCGPCKALTQVINNAGEKVTIPVENVNIDENIFLAQLKDRLWRRKETSVYLKWPNFKYIFR